MNAAGPRIALFGGSFDPPHRAHLAIAQAAVEQAPLDRVVFIPCRESPLKGKLPGAPAGDRLAMLRLATMDCPWAQVDDWELRQPGPSYSWQTAQHFSSLHPHCALHWLMGVDQWEALDRWARPETLRALLTFIVFTRDGVHPRPREGWRAIFLTGEFSGSSTEVRGLLAAGRSAAELLPPGVEEYAVSAGLYLPGGHQ